jgi:hypothetical protein
MATTARMRLIPIVAALVDTSRGLSNDAGKVERCGPGWFTTGLRGPRSSGGGFATVVPVPATPESEGEGEGLTDGDGEGEDEEDGCGLGVFVIAPPGVPDVLAPDDGDADGGQVVMA